MDEIIGIVLFLAVTMVVVRGVQVLLYSMIKKPP